ncbi:hypothetical protein [uncultured Lactobacillus sp.]|uniref:hypothetical protein n=1 Tax=uncultured Lactobacillus sp. TaxID=153152 RepID=UPI00262BEAF6|nr:hypothetical protein [uncultured Lactobacillus sp.]
MFKQEDRERLDELEENYKHIRDQLEVMIETMFETKKTAEIMYKKLQKLEHEASEKKLKEIKNVSRQVMGELADKLTIKTPKDVVRITFKDDHNIEKTVDFTDYVFKRASHNKVSLHGDAVWTYGHEFYLVHGEKDMPCLGEKQWFDRFIKNQTVDNTNRVDHYAIEHKIYLDIKVVEITQLVKDGKVVNHELD